MQIFQKRVYLPTETLGSFYNLEGVVLCKTMELPWRNNQRNISCIPEGSYQVVKEPFTKKHPYPHFRVLNVPKRSGILLHRITYVKDLRGCLGIGEAFKDLNKDGVPDIIGSTIALQELYDTLPEDFELIISEKQKQVIPVADSLHARL